MPKGLLGWATSAVRLQTKELLSPKALCTFEKQPQSFFSSSIPNSWPPACVFAILKHFCRNRATTYARLASEMTDRASLQVALAGECRQCSRHKGTSSRRATVPQHLRTATTHRPPREAAHDARAVGIETERDS